MKKFWKQNQILLFALLLTVATVGYFKIAGARKEKRAAQEKQAETALSSIEEEGGDEGETPGEAILVSANSGKGAPLAGEKLVREQTRAKTKEDLLEIIDSEKVSKEEKKRAVESMTAYTENIEQEDALEMLLAGNGFSDSVVSIQKENVDVLVASEALSEEEAAVILEVVMRRLSVPASQVVITPVAGDPSF